MRIGITVFLTDLTIDPVTLARGAEVRGFGSIYFPEHTHIPVSRLTPTPYGNDLPEEYKRTLDPLVALGGAAAVTSRIALGTCVSLVAQHHPLTMAKSLATLDLMSNGRVTLGVGFGWNEDEMVHHGVEYRTRRDRVREHMLAMMALWSQDEASFEGRYVSFNPSWSWPKPVQQPRPRVLMGGAAGPKLFAHIAEYADGWFPIGGAGARAAIPALQEAWREAGRDGEPEVVPMGVIGTPEKLDYYEQIGCTEVVLRVDGAAEAPTLQQLDELARLLDR